MFYPIVGICIFALTLAVIMIRPFWITEAEAAAGGALLMILGGYVRPVQAIEVLRAEWNVYGFFLGLMTISTLAERAGVFEWLAWQAGRWGRGRAWRLYLAIFAVGALITVCFSNDATALMLTPIVYAIVTRLRLPVLPFVFACTFIADTASFVLPVSNPINVLVLDAFGGSLVTFLRYLLLPGLFCISLNVAVFAFLFRGDLGLDYDTATVDAAKPDNGPFFRFSLVALALIAIGYVIASAAQLPLSTVALAGAVLLLAGAVWHRQLDRAALQRGISWSLFVFISGMFLVVRGVENLGLTDWFCSALLQMASGNQLAAIMVTAAATALGANLINNVPMALVMISALHQIQPTSANQPSLVYATILGADLGPNLTTVGSLATMLWLLILRRKGLDISTAEYFKLGISVVPVMILVGSILIWLHL